MTPDALNFFIQILKEGSGLSIGPDKSYLLENRLAPIAQRNGMLALDDLAKAIARNPRGPLKDAVIDAMTTNETSFFRDKDPFRHFENIIMPALAASKRPGEPIRIWSAAASSGQEAYSLAITLKENSRLAGTNKVEIIGTDISASILEKAKSGFYSQFEVQRGLPIQTLLKYFEQDGDMWRINSDIRAMVKFREFNLLDPMTALPKFDAVFCRNVLIYFDQQTKKDVLSRLARQINPGGFLVLGGAETVVGLSGDFRKVDGAFGVFQPAKVLAKAAV